MPNPGKQTPYVPNYANVPPNSPPAIKAAPNPSLPTQAGTMSAYPTTQHRHGAYIATSYDPPVPPVYTFEAPTYTAPVTVRVQCEVDKYAKMEKDSRIKEEDSITSQLDSLKRALKSLQITRESESLDYDDLCIHPDIDMLVGYKPPKFDIFSGMGGPHAHLRAYCDKLVG